MIITVQLKYNVGQISHICRPRQGTSLQKQAVIMPTINYVIWSHQRVGIRIPVKTE